ncbi:hypothetical protein Tco_0184660 [Tanacetum coccineum]
MAGSQFNKYRDDRVSIIRVMIHRVMLQIQGVIIQPVQEVTGLRVLQQLIRQGSSVVTISGVRDIWLDNALNQKGQGILNGSRRRYFLFRHRNLTNDLDAFDSDCDEAPSARAMLMANLSNYD